MNDYLSFQIDFNQPDVVSLYDELPLWSAMFGLLMFKHLPLKRGITALDIGYGTGFPLIELAQRLGSTSKVHGVDPWEAARQRASHKARLWQVGNVELHCCDAAALPFADETFDLIVSNLGINNFSDPQTVLKECWRTARPNARLALTTNLQGHMQEFYQVYEDTLRQLGREDRIPELHRHIAQRASVDGVSQLFEQAGFQVTAVHQETTSMRFVDGSSLFNHSFIKLGFLDGWKSVLPEKDLRAVFQQMESNLNRWAEGYGELSLTIPMAYIEGQKL